MGRKKIKEEQKKVTIKINIPVELYKTLEELEVKSKSKLFNWLLKEHFNSLSI